MLQPDSSSTKRSSFMVPGALVATAVLSGLIVVSNQLLSSRPASTKPPAIAEPQGEYKTEAYLWQDPLEPVLLKVERDKRQENQSQEQGEKFRNLTSLQVLQKQISSRLENLEQEGTGDQEASGAHIIFAMIRDRFTAEDREWRVRARYAVVKALHANGFYGTDTEHISYFRANWLKDTDIAEKLSDVYGKNSITKVPQKSIFYNKKLIDKDTQQATLVRLAKELVCPYEWFEYDSLRSFDRPLRNNVLVVWLPESDFSDYSLTKIALLLQLLGVNTTVNHPSKKESAKERKLANEEPDSTIREKARIDIIGPSSSASLRSIIKDARFFNQIIGEESALDGVKFYSAISTVEPNLLFEAHKNESNKEPKAIQSSLRSLLPANFASPEYLRTVGTDGQLAGQLIGELQRRGVKLGLGQGEKSGVGDRITLVYEEDSFYGRSFRLAFAAAYDAIVNGEDPTYVADPSVDAKQNEGFYTALTRYRVSREFPPSLQSYGYIRGVDGLRPNKDSTTASVAAQPPEGQLSSTAPEVPIGEQQLDYTRRLAQRIYLDYSRTGIKPKAIGIIGSDVYDKLLLVQALRPYFPEAICFTTDLDSRLFYYEQFRWTHNMIVASHYGLQLNDERFVFGGDGSPNFRDSYQTAFYLSCCAALSPRVDSKKVLPVSSSEFIKDLGKPRLFELGRDCAVDISVEKDYQATESIHPPRGTPLPFYNALTFLGIFVAVLCGGALFYQANGQFRELCNFIYGLKSNARSVWILLVLFVCGPMLVVAVVLLGVFDHVRPGGEPFSMTQGVSAWPSIVLRFLAVVLCACLIVKARHDLASRAKRVEQRFDIQPASNPPEFSIQATGFFDWCQKWFRYRRDISPAYWDVPAHEEVDLESVCSKYKVLAENKHRWTRLFTMSVLYLLFCGALFLIFPIPNAPYRGSLSWWTGHASGIFSGLALILLTFYVVDVTVLCQRFVRILSARKTKWSPRTLRLPEVAQRKLNSADAAEWLDVQLTAEWTETVGKLIQYPFIILLILVVARSSYFDNWTWPFPVIVSYALILAYALGCSLSLRKRAEKTRRFALERLQTSMIGLSNSAKTEDRRRKEQIVLLKEEIRSMRQGAFSPLAENPIVSAILIPSGGVTLFALWDLISTFW